MLARQVIVLSTTTPGLPAVDSDAAVFQITARPKIGYKPTISALITVHIDRVALYIAPLHACCAISPGKRLTVLTSGFCASSALIA